VRNHQRPAQYAQPNTPIARESGTDGSYSEHGVVQSIELVQQTNGGIAGPELSEGIEFVCSDMGRPTWMTSVRAYLLKEYFQLFREYNSPAWAGNFLDRWCQGAMRSRIEPRKKSARTVRSHRELLLNYFRARKEFSRGVIEGFNNKAKVTMRKAYGFRTFKAKELALYSVLGKLPEPPLAHSSY
jgi:hypothetical protein